MAFDQEIAENVQYLASPSLTALMKAFTYLGEWHVIVSFFLIIVGYYVLTHRLRSAEYLTVTMIAIGGVWAIKHFFDRERPELLRLSSEVLTTSAFPSGHATLSIAFYGFLAFLLLRSTRMRAARLFILAIATIVIAGIGMSRIYLGVHWATDVLAGWILGATVLLTMICLSHRHARSV